LRPPSRKNSTPRGFSDGEHEEYNALYPEFARVAREEGFPDVATQFLLTSRAEKHHEERYRMLLRNLTEEKVFKKKNTVAWICRECGYVHEGAEAPKVCPCCEHPQAFYQVLTDVY
jgi:rubrerythrin